MSLTVFMFSRQGISQTRRSSASAPGLDLFNDLGNLFSEVDNKPHNVFLIKFSYRFGLK